MQEGFILERNMLATYAPIVWVEGAPEPSLWTLTKVTKKTILSTVTYRCVGCGYVESYANAQCKANVKPE